MHFQVQRTNGKTFDSALDDISATELLPKAERSLTIRATEAVIRRWLAE